MMLVLRGKILSPIVTKKTSFPLEGCKAIIINPRRRYNNKITSGKPMYPYSFVCYLGTIELRYIAKSFRQLKRKLADLLRIQSIGRFSSEGFGLIRWTEGYTRRMSPKRFSNKKRKRVRIRKGLPHNLPEDVQELIQYALLHDFVHTSRHRSKIYVEPEFTNLEHLRKHHEKINDPLIQTFQKYDCLAAIITRKVRSPRTNRYNWKSNRNIDFNVLANQIKEVSTHLWKLYEYIYHSQELKQLNESLEHGHTSLRTHLLLIANLIVRDYQRHTLCCL